MSASFRIEQDWDYRSAGLIWRLLPTGQSNLVGEDRDTSKKTVSFFCLECETGTPLWRGVTVEEPWWVSIEGVYRDVVILHEYPFPGMPDHGKIISIDLHTGRKLWSNDTLKFVTASGESVYGARDLYDRRQFHELDLRSGEFRREVDTQTIQGLKDPVAEPVIDYELPEPGSGIPSVIRDALGRADVVDETETMTTGAAHVVSCYERAEGDEGMRILRQHLFITDLGRDEILFHDVVCDDLALPAPDTFFRFTTRLYYIKDKTRLRALHLIS